MAIGCGVACPKPESLKTAKGRKARAEKAVEKLVREHCALRDGMCRASVCSPWGDDLKDEKDAMRSDGCDGLSEWAHMHIRRRSKTRGMAPEDRHDTQHSLMLCRFHHQAYDAKRLIITALTRKGADGGLKFRSRDRVGSCGCRRKGSRGRWFEILTRRRFGSD